MTRSSLARAAAAPLATLCVLGCAHPGPVAPEPAILEVLNRTDLPIDIAVAGQVLRTVAAHSRARLRALAPGEHAVEALPAAETRRQEPRFAARVTLSRGAVTVWNLALGPDDAEPPPLGDLEVESRLAHDVTLRAGSAVLGTVLAGDRRRFHDLPAGAYALEASDLGRTLVVRGEAEVPPNGLTRWVMTADYAVLGLVNDTAEDVTVQLDGQPLGAVDASQERVFGELAPGGHDLVVTSSSGRRYARSVELRPDFPVVWRLASSGAALAITNHAGEPLTLGGDAGTPRTVPVLGTERLRDLPPGSISVTARGEESQAPFALRAELGTGQEGAREVRAVERSLTVVNGTEGALFIYLDGAPHGRLEPGARITSTLARQRVHAEALDLTASRYHQADLEVGPTGIARWEIATAKGDLRVENLRSEPVAVFVDARRLGPIAAGSSLTFTGIEVGTRLFEALGAETGRVIRGDLPILPESVAAWRLDDPRGQLTLENESGETLEPLGALAVLGQPVPSGTSARFPVAPGRRQVQLRGRESGILYARLAEIPAEGTYTWRVGPARASLAATSQLAEAVTVAVDGREVGRLGPGQTLELPDLPAGLHRLRAKGTQTGFTQSSLRLLAPGEYATCLLTAEPSQIRVDNGSDEVQRVLLDGTEYGSVSPGASKLFGALHAGPVELWAVGEKSSIRQGFRLQLLPGLTERVGLDAGQGRLVVANHSPGTAIVRVDEVEVARLQAGAPPSLVSVRAGQRWVAIDDLAGARLALRLVRVEPDRALEISVESPSARLAIANRTAGPRRVWLGDRLLGTLAPGESLLESDLVPGEAALSATEPEGAPTHLERRTLAPGETSSWVLR